MWFKNLRCYRFSSEVTLDAESLAEQMEALRFTPCGSNELSKMGWVSPLGREHKELVHAAEGNFLISLQKEDKLLPSSVVNEMLAEKVAEIEAAESRPVRKKEKEALKENITHQLLPRAFSRYSRVFAYVSLKEQWIVVDSSSSAKAEEVLSLLRKSIGSLPVEPLAGSQAIDAEMTHWLVEGPMPEGLYLGTDAELKEPAEDGAIVRVKNLAMDSDEIKSHLANHMRVNKLAVQWLENLTCMLESDLSIKKLKFTDVVKDTNDDIPSEDAMAKLDADFALMTGEINRFIEDLIKIFKLDDDK